MGVARRSPALIPNEPPPCEQAAALDRQTAEMARWREAIFGADGGEGVWESHIGPALGVVVTFGARLDALCRFLKAKWWLWLAAVLFLQRTVNMAPDDVPKLISAVAEIAKAFGGH